MTTRVEPTDAELEDWIDGATFVQVKVDIHRNPALWSELEPLYRLIEAAEARLNDVRATERKRDPDATLAGTEPATAPTGEQALGEIARTPASVVDAQADLDDLLEQADALYARYDADKETWTIRGLDPAELRAIGEAHDRPAGAAPVRRKGEPLARFTARSTAHRDQISDYQDAINEHALSVAVVDVLVHGEHMPPPSLEGLRRLRARPHGERHFAELVAAMESLTLREVAIPAPHR